MPLRNGFDPPRDPVRFSPEPDQARATPPRWAPPPPSKELPAAIEAWVTQRPVVTLLTALVVGAAVAWLIKRR